MRNACSFSDISKFEKSVKDFFECDEKIKNLTSELFEIDAEMFLSTQMIALSDFINSPDNFKEKVC